MIIYNKTFSNESEKAAFVRECDEEFLKKAIKITSDIFDDENVKFVLLSGPTCSGKTTVSKIFENELKTRTRVLHTVSIDDFYKPIDTSDPMWHTKNMESVDAIDLQLFSECIESFIQKGKANLPVFNFAERTRVGFRELTLAKGEVVILEGIQAIYPQIYSLIPDELSKSVYISVSKGVMAYGYDFSPRQIRLTRRLIRDMFYRGTDPDMALEIWKNVEQNEIEYIEPYKDTVPYQIDSLLLYEFNVMANYVADLKGKNPMIDYLRDVYSKFPRISPSYVPENSLFNEFIKL